MKGCQLSDGGTVSVRHAPALPGVKALVRQAKLLPEQLVADGAHQFGMGVWVFKHSPVYQRNVDTSSPHSFICRARLLLHKRSMTLDKAFGARLRAAIDAANFRSVRQFALEGMGWDADTGPQRMNNYVKGRVPDYDTLRNMCQVLGTAPTALLNEGADDGLRDILLQLLALEGIPLDRADTLASVAVEAKRQLEAWPDEGALETRAKLAAHAAWRQRQSQSIGT